MSTYNHKSNIADLQSYRFSNIIKKVSTYSIINSKLILQHDSLRNVIDLVKFARHAHKDTNRHTHTDIHVPIIKYMFMHIDSMDNV